MTALGRRQWLAAMAALAVGCGRGPGPIASLQRGVMALAAAGDKLLWVTGPDDGTLFVAPLSGDDPRPLVEGLSWPRHLVVSAGQAWLACRDKLLRVPLSGAGGVAIEAKEALRVAPLGGSDPSAAFWIAADGGLSFTQAGKSARRYQAAPWPSALAVSGGVAYWACGQPGVLYRTDSGGDTRALGQASAITDIAVAGERLLYTTGEALCARPLSGGEETILCGGLRGPSALVVEQSRAFFIDGPARPGGPDRLMQLMLSAGSTPTVVAELEAAQGLALAAEQLFSASATGRAVWRFPLG